MDIVVWILISACLLLGQPAAAVDRPAQIRALFDSGQNLKAESAALAWTSDLEAAGDKQSLRYAAALDLLGEALSTKGAPLAEAEPVLKRSIEIKSALLGADDAAIGESLLLLGQLRYRAGQYAPAILDFNRVLALAKKDHPLLEASALVGLGLSLGSLGKPKEAVPLHEQALAIRERELGNTHWRYADGLLALAQDMRQLGKLEETWNYASRAVEILRRSNPKHPATATGINLMATVYRERGQSAQARPLFEEAIELFRESFGRDSARLVPVYNNYGLAMKSQGEYRIGAEAMEEALRIALASFGARSPVAAQVLGNLGILHRESGDYDGARRAYEQALVILQANLGNDHDNTASVMSSLGIVLRDLGDLAAAKAMLERALKVYRQRLGARHPKTIQVELAVASVWIQEENFNAALPIVKEAAEAALANGGASDQQALTANASLAAVYSGLGKLDTARELYRSSIEGLEKNANASAFSITKAYRELAELEIKMREYGPALEHAKRAETGFRNLFGPDHVDLARALETEAVAELQLGNRAAALQQSLEGARVRRQSLKDVARGTAERMALAYAERSGNALDVGLRMAAAGNMRGQDVAAVWDALIRERALVLDEMAERKRAAHGMDLALARARQDLAQAVVAGPGEGEKNHGAKLARLRETVEKRDRELAYKSAAYRDRNAQESAGLKETLRALPRGAALVGYARYSGGYLAFAQRVGELYPIAISLAGAKQVEGLYREWRTQIDREGKFLGRGKTKGDALYLEAGAALREAVWDPVAKRIDGATEVFVVADGVLQFLNLGSLPDRTGIYLVERGPELHLLSTERDVSQNNRTAKARGLLAVGAPAYGNAALNQGTGAGCAAYRNFDFAELPGAAAEIEQVARLWRESGKPVETLTGVRATKEALRARVAGKGTIHIATHGFFIEGDCGLGDPLLRAGLAFAGANRHQGEGILTAEEIASFDLSAAQLVVLSGCDTGMGELRAGEGVLGLRRAFQIAGARSLVMSLWPVGDEDAMAWMGAFYRARVKRSRSEAAAAREATVERLRALRTAGKSTHPYYWASFTALGGG